MAIFSQPIEPDSYIPLRVQVYDALKDAIVGGSLRPGERIIEDRVCAELGVSRSPLREALRKLEGEGLVSILPRRGAVVTEVSSQDIINLFAVREALEGLAARQASQVITRQQLAELDQLCEAMEQRIQARDMAEVVALNTQFHELITAASLNRWIKEFLTSVKDQARRFYRSSIELQGRAPESVAEHRLIIEALKAQDPERAEALARQHVQRARSAALSAGITSAR